MSRICIRLMAGLVAGAALTGCAGWQGIKLLVAGDNVELREPPEPDAANAARPDILLLALDGVGRDLLYDMLRDGELPELARLLGGSDGNFEHAWFDDRLTSTLPSSTGVAWATAITGRTPAEHGVVGNEYFIRERNEFAAPVPVTVDTVTPVLRIYTDGYANDLLEVPTVYQRLREREPAIRIAVAMHQFYAGADELILADRSALIEALRTFVSAETVDRLTGGQSLSVFSNVDREVMENVTESIDVGDTADVLTVYIPGVDHFAHVSDLGPDAARRLYLKKVLEPAAAELLEELKEDGEAENRYVVVTSDHGHTEVAHSDRNSLAVEGDDEPPALLASAGYTLRPFSLDVADDVYFDTVLAYQGALAYVYVANQASCPVAGMLCDWGEPAREADILPVAELFYRNNLDGERVPELRGALDMILVRQPGARGNPFRVYTGSGRTATLDDYLADHPHPRYLELQRRLADLADGPHGDRAGDLILIAHNGDRARPQDRYYFASLYHSWHGSPSRHDAQVPLIVAHPGKPRAQLRAAAETALAGGHSLAAVSRLLLALRAREEAAQE